MKFCKEFTPVVLLLAIPAFGQGFLIAPALYAVQGAPFSAVVESAWDGSDTAPPGWNRSREMRDAAGRERLEMPTVEDAAANGEMARVTIYDFGKEQIVVLDTVSRTARITPMTHVGRTMTLTPSTTPTQGACPVFPGEVALGTRMIVGLETCGHQLVQTFQKHGVPKNEVRDLWLSRTYAMPLAATREDERLGTVHQEVVEFNPQDPDPALFEIPLGYRVLR